MEIAVKDRRPSEEINHKWYHRLGETITMTIISVIVILYFVIAAIALAADSYESQLGEVPDRYEALMTKVKYREDTGFSEELLGEILAWNEEVIAGREKEKKESYRKIFSAVYDKVDVIDLEEEMSKRE